MPDYNELKKQKTYLKESEKDNSNPEFQLDSQRGVGCSPPDEEGGLSAGSDNANLLFFIREAHLQEAQEFRRRGFNSQIPEVDPGLLTKLRETLTDIKALLSFQTNVEGPLGSGWQLEQITKIERLTGQLSNDGMQSWVKHEVPCKGSREKGMGSRRTAQSLVRRLEATLQTLIRVVHTLRAIDDHSRPKKLGEQLVTELVSAFSARDERTLIQALEKMNPEDSGDTAWASLMKARVTSWETDKVVAIRTIIETTRHEAEKANKKARALQGYSASQAFFSRVATYLQSLSVDLTNELTKMSGDPSQSMFSSVMPYVNDEKAVVPLSHSDSLPQRLMAGVSKKKSQTQIALAGGEGKLYQLARIIQHGHPTKTPSKNTERVIADSVIRSILWQWQQPAIQIQYASGAILSKVKELKKIEEMFLSEAVVYGKGSQQEVEETSVIHPGEDDLDAQVSQWVHDSIEEAKPASQQAEKLAVLKKLLDSDIDNARTLIRRLREKADSMPNLLKKQRLAVLKMIILRTGLDPSLRAVDKLLPDVAGDLTKSLAALEYACQAAAIRDFSEAEKQADYVQLRAIKVKESISAESVRLTERPLDEHSRGSRLAKHWANIAKEHNLSNDRSVGAEQVFSSLKKQGLLEGILSTGDPEGYLFATRLAGELENARHDELRLPMSPEQYTALERGLVEYIVKWGQNRVSRGIARIIIELSFEQGLDAVSFSVSSLFRIPFKVLKASIKVPYNVNKVNNYTMPGHDKPYKAIYGMLEKKLKQLEFNIVTAPVPGMIKLVAGAGITAGATLYNLHVGSREKKFSAVYQHLTEGKKSEKIKTDSVRGMVFDSVIDSATSVVFKGGDLAWKSEESENNPIHKAKEILNGETFSYTQSGEDEIEASSGADFIIRGDYEADSSHSIITPTNLTRLDGNECNEGFYKSRNVKIVKRHLSEYDAFNVKDSGGIQMEIAAALVEFETHNKDEPGLEIKSIIFVDEYIYNKMQSTDENKIEYKQEWLKVRRVLNIIDNKAIKKYLDFRLAIESYAVHKGALLISDMSDSRKELISHMLNLFDELELGAEVGNDNAPIDINNAICAFMRSDIDYLDLEGVSEISINQCRREMIIKIAPIIFSLNNKIGTGGISEDFLAIINSYLHNGNVISGDTVWSHRDIVSLIGVLLKIQNNYRDACDLVTRVDNLQCIILNGFKRSEQLFLDNRIMAAQIYCGVTHVSLSEDRFRWIKEYENIKCGSVDEQWRLLHIESIINYLQMFGIELRHDIKWINSMDVISIFKDDTNLALEKILLTNLDGLPLLLNFQTRRELRNNDAEYYSQFDRYIDNRSAERDARSQLFSVVSNLKLSIGDLFFEGAQDVKVLSYVYREGDGDVATVAPGRVIIIKLKGDNSGAIIMSNLFLHDHVSRISDSEYRQLDPIFNGYASASSMHRSLKGPYYHRGTQLEHSVLFEILTGVSERKMRQVLRARDIGLGHPARFSFRYPDQESVEHLLNINLREVILGAKAIQNEVSARFLRTAMYSLTEWEVFAYRLIPFYEIGHRNENDRDYEISITEFVTDLITAISIIYPAAKGVTSIVRSSSISTILRSGLTGKGLFISLSKEITRLGYSSSKVLGSALYEFIEPFPLKIPIDRRSLLDDVSGETKATHFPSDWEVDDPRLLHVNPDEGGLYKIERPSPTALQSFNFYIERESKFYQVNYDSDSSVWRLIPPEGSGKLGYQAPVARNLNGEWELRRDVRLTGGLRDFLDDMRAHSREAPSLPPAPPLAARLPDTLFMQQTRRATSLTPGSSSALIEVTPQVINVSSVTPNKLIEPLLESRVYGAFSQQESFLIQETTSHLKLMLGEQYNTFTIRPKENCANAAITVAAELRRSGYTDVKIVELGIWPNGGIDTMPTNHYIVMAKKYEVDIVVDLTAGQFERYEFSGPIISTQNDWLYQWQQKLNNKNMLLVKMAPLSGGITTSPFSLDYVNPQRVVPNGVLLKRPNWYKRELL